MKPTPGAALVHPVPVAAMAALIANDHWLKYAFPGWMTGKLSDFGGLAFFPLLLQSLWELTLTIGRRHWRPSRAAIVVSVLATAIVFTLVKTWAPATSLFSWTLGVLQWPALAVMDVVQGRSPSEVRPVDARTDPTDLIALPALLLAFVPARSRTEVSSRP